MVQSDRGVLDESSLQDPGCPDRLLIDEHFRPAIGVMRTALDMIRPSWR